MVLIFNSICIVLKGKGYTKKNSIDRSGDVSTTCIWLKWLYSVPGTEGGVELRTPYGKYTAAVLS